MTDHLQREANRLYYRYQFTRALAEGRRHDKERAELMKESEKFLKAFNELTRQIKQRQSTA